MRTSFFSNANQPCHPPTRQASSHRLLLLLVSAVFLCGVLPGAPFACGDEKPRSNRPMDEADNAKWIKLTIPLKQGRFYSLYDVLRESNAKLKTTYDLKELSDRQYELTDPAKRMLRALALASGSFRVQFSRDRLVLYLPNPENPAVRKHNHQLLSRWFHLKVLDWTGKGLKLPRNFQSTRRTILLIHGLESNPGAMSGLARACRNWGIQVLTFSYPNDGPIAESGRRLRHDLLALGAKYPRLRLVIVAHSMGGLVARYALEHPEKCPQCVTDLFTLGTPHRGSHLAEGHPWLELVSEALPGIAKGNFFGSLQDGLGEAAKDLTPGSRFLKILNRQKRPAGIRYHTAAGRRGIVSPEEYQVLVFLAQQLLVQRQVAQATRAKVLGFLKQSADELRTGTGDGAVALSSALLSGAANKKTFNCDHMGLITVPSAHPERDAVFQWIVQSLKWPQQTIK